MAIPIDGASATVTCPAIISAAPTVISQRDPTRSISTPTGICMAA